MNIKTKFLIIIPTYNESKSIKRLIEEILSLGDHLEILVVDDGSQDGTSELLDELAREDRSLHIIHQQVHIGIGSAYKKGFKYALSNGFDYIFQMDGDFSHDPGQIKAFLERIEDCDIIIGSRYIKGGKIVNWPLTRLILRRFANLYTRIITGLKIRDATSGFNCFKRNISKNIDLDAIKSDGYAFQIELKNLCCKNGFRFREIPITFY